MQFRPRVHFIRRTEAQTDMHPNDVLVLYSDGVTEAGIDHGDEFGEEHLIASIREHATEPAAKLAQRIVDEVSQFSGASRSDDVTVVVLRGL